MRHWAMGMRILGVVLATGLMFGCEKNQPPEETTPYDSHVDAPPTNLTVNPNPDLVENQARVARKTSAQASSGAPASVTPGAGTPADEDPRTKAVRDELAKMVEAAKSGQLPSILTYVSAKDADTMKDAVNALASLATAEAAMAKALKTNLGKEPPASLTQAMDKGPNGGPILARLAGLAPADLTVTAVDDNTVKVQDATGSQWTFTKSDDKWVISLSDAQTQVYAALAELAKLQALFATKIADGLGNSTVTEQNLDEQIMNAAGTFTDARGRLKEAMAAQPATAPANP